jgi:hypothetical protein
MTHGPYPNRQEAMAFAINAAQKLGRPGECAYVRVLDDDGRLRSKWTYDREHRLRRVRARPMAEQLQMRRGRFFPSLHYN